MKAWLFLCLALCAGLAGASELPAPIKALQKQGLTIRGEMTAPPGFKGYVGEYGGQRMPVYLLPDGKHVVIGPIYDADGNDLTNEAFTAANAPKIDAADWKALEASTWIADGAKSPKRIVYVFTDTQCPYCHRLWAEVQPLLKGGDVQVRYLPVAVIAPDSLGRAAAILSAPDPLTAMRQHESNFRNSPIKPMEKVPADVRAKIAANVHLMDKLGANGTPAIVYRDANGAFHMTAGLPTDQKRLQAIFGH